MRLRNCLRRARGWIAALFNFIRTLAITWALFGTHAESLAQSVDDDAPKAEDFYDILSSCWAILDADGDEADILRDLKWRRIDPQNEVDLMLKAKLFEKEGNPIVLRRFGIQCTGSGAVANLEVAIAMIEELTERSKSDHLNGVESYNANGARILKLSGGREAMLSVQNPARGLILVIDTQFRSTESIERN